MTPPSQRPTLLTSNNAAQQTVSVQQHKSAQSGSSSSTSSDVPMVSPSELDTSVFKSPTPSEISENQNPKTATDPGKPHLTTADTSSSEGSRNADSKSDSDAGTNANMLAPGDDDKIITSERPMEVDVTEVGVDKATPDKEGANPIQVDDKSQEPTRQISITGNSSPRMCLSLKKVKVTASSARKLLNMNVAEDKNPLETSAQFVLGVGANEGDLDSSVESQFHLPAVQVPSDSQFELSGDSQSLFQIQNPAASEPAAQPPVSSSQKQAEKRGNPPSTLFSFVNPAQSSRQAIKKAKESNQAELSLPPLQEVVPNQGGGNDPYAYDLQNVDNEVDFIMQRTAKRAASGQNAKKAPNLVSKSHSASQNRSEQGDPEEEKAAENVPVFSSEPPSLSTADIRRPHIHQPPSHSQSHEEGSQNIISRTGDQALLGSQSAAAANTTTNNQSEAPSGSQPLADNITPRSQSPFLSPSLVLPSTSSGSLLPSISPSAAVPSSLVDELKKRAGLDRGGDYQLKLIKVVRTIVEERHVFAEDVRQGHVLQNSGRSWIVS